ncbi:MAG: CHAT domain-containing tetratricopeptide repeat protein [Pseudomonadota bacterium]
MTVVRATCVLSSSLVALLIAAYADAGEIHAPLYSKAGVIPGAAQVTHRITVEKPGRYFLEIDQKGIDLHATLRRAGREQLTVNTLTGHIGPEVLAFELEQEELLQLDLEAPDQPGVSGSYRINLYSVGSNDADRWDGLTLLTEAGALGTGRADANRTASMKILNDATRSFERSGDLELQAHAHYWAATNLYWLLDVAAAEEHYRLALRMFESMGHDLMRIVVATDIAAAIMEVQRFDEAQEIYSRSILRLANMGEALLAARTQNNYGLMFLYKNELAHAEMQFRAAEAAFRQAGHVARAAQTLANIALVHDRRAELRRARELYLESLDSLPPNSNSWLRSIFLTNLASVELSLANANQALTYLGEVKVLQEDTGDAAGLAWTLSGIADIYRSISRPGDALPFQKQSVEIRRNREEGGGLANALLRLGDDYRETGRRERDDTKLLLAVEQHRQALEYASNDRQRSEIHLGLTRNHLALTDYAAAEVHLAAATKLAEQTASAGVRIDVALELARMPLVDTGMLERSLRAALIEASVYEDQSKFARVSAAIAGITQDPYEARRLNEQALEVLAKERKSVANPWLQVRLTDYEYPVVEQQLALLLAGGHDELSSKAALSFAIEYRANALTALLQDLERPIGSSVDPAVLTELDAAYAGYREALARSALEQGSAEARETSVEQELSAIDIARARVLAERPQYAELAFPSVPPLEEVQALLQISDAERAGLLIYFVGAERSYAWFVTPDEITSWELPGQNELDAAVTSLNDSIINLNTTPTVELRRSLLDVSRWLLPANRYLRDVDRLFVMPDGPIGAVPFAALPLPGSRLYLVEQLPIVSMPSTQMLRTRHASPSNPIAETVFVAGPARTRVFKDTAGRQKSASQVAPDPRYRFVDASDLNVTRFESEIGNAAIVHFATHAWVNTQSPSLSGLQLDAEQRRSFTLADIYQLNLGADLIVLSACETGLGELIRGEGAQSLVRGFLYAGARNVVATIWRNDERSSSLFSVRFHAELRKNGGDPVTALRETQLWMLKENPEMRHPYYWAGHVITRGVQ